MATNEVLTTTNLPIGTGKKHSGKVRDIYDLDPYLLIVTTDRISAFDVVLPDGIPMKGHILNQLSVLWLRWLACAVPNHFITDNVDKYPAVCQPYAELLNGRSMLVKKARPLPVECIVRGYLSGSAWKSYRENGTVCGIKLPAGLREADKLPEPIFTPSTKAENGEHDININYDQMMAKVGGVTTFIAAETSLSLYRKASELAERAGIIIADTKFEFGLDENGDDMLIDEVLTPDSSRFWPAANYEPGGAQPSFDKQFVRDYLASLGWEGQTPAPSLPEEVIKQTSKKYLEAYTRLAMVLKK